MRKTSKQSVHDRIAEATASLFLFMNAEADGDQCRAEKAQRDLKRLGVTVTLDKKMVREVTGAA